MSASAFASADNLEERGASTGCPPIQGFARAAQGPDAQRHERSLSDPAKRIFVSTQNYQDDPLYGVYHGVLALDLVGFEEFKNPAQLVMGFRRHEKEAEGRVHVAQLAELVFRQEKGLDELAKRNNQLEGMVSSLAQEVALLQGRLKAVSAPPGPSSWPKDSFVQSYRWGPFVQGDGVTALFDEMAGFMPASKEGVIEGEEIPGPALQTSVFFRDASGGKGSVLVADQRVAQFYDESPLTSPSISPAEPVPRTGSRSGPSIPPLDWKRLETKMDKKKMDKKKKKKKKGRRSGVDITPPKGVGGAALSQPPHE
ncbi:MAG: hypothetical protein C0514_05105 [Candidatus Puniceispirillum sp.]|nr:hypothetical protein [Candidatus Puniceispirillum sp.]